MLNYQEELICYNILPSLRKLDHLGDHLKVSVNYFHEGVNKLHPVGKLETDNVLNKY